MNTELKTRIMAAARDRAPMSAEIVDSLADDQFAIHAGSIREIATRNFNNGDYGGDVTLQEVVDDMEGTEVEVDGKTYTVVFA